ncbi:unnamed protein product [Clavelina lepadiformis]|uniref:Uncharacterized protein n=1 Tax=Clavelina lepadiformis TaxID=159417 RepID=A0ABP0FR11_CLALP
MNETEKEAWQAFRGVVDGFLGNKRDRNYKETQKPSKHQSRFSEFLSFQRMPGTKRSG